MVTTFAPLWLDGQRVSDGALDALAARMARGIQTLPPGRAIKLPTDPVASIVARTVLRDYGLPYALGETTLQIAGVRPLADITADGTVRVEDAHTARVPEGVARIAATSGSTGRPEAVAHDEAAIQFQAQALQQRLQIEADDTMLLPLPSTHAYGASVVELWSRFGVGLMLEHEDPLGGLPRRLLQGQVTSVDLVPTMLATLLSAASRDGDLARAIHALRFLNVGGDVLPSTLMERALTVCGAQVLNGYGLTEAGPNVAVNSPDLYRPGTVGKPLTGVEVCLREGELCTRSASTMLGYLHDGVLQPQVDTDGWLHTGDLGSITDEGFVQIAGRRKEVIMIHGRTFAPVAVEDVLRQVEGVQQVGVIGVRPDTASRDHVLAFIQTSPGTPERHIVRQCAGHLPEGLGPIRVQVVSQLPLLATGKVDRSALRRRVPLCT